MKKQTISSPKNILCYVDYGSGSPALVDYAHRIARAADSDLYLLHTVTDLKSAAGFYVPHINTDKLEEELIQAARDKMYAICTQVIGDIPADHRLVVRGNPVDIITETIAEKHIDLLVLGHEINRGTLTVFRSDHAERVLKNPPCPFLVVPFREA